MSEVKLSIIIPIYNAEAYLRPCIESCYKQGMPESTFELIAINDGSTDKSTEILKEFATVHNNIIIVTQKNSGVSIARNKGIEIAQGNYLLFLDADDVLVSNSLIRMIVTAKENNVDILRADLLKLNNTEIENRKDNSLFITPILPQCLDGETAFINHFNPMEGYVWRNLYKTEFLKDNKILFLEGVSFIEDIAFNIHSYTSAKRILIIPYAFYLYRQHNASVMANMNIEKLSSANQVVEYIYSLSQKKDCSLSYKKKLKDAIYAILNLILWYLSHYHSLYSHRKEIIDDLKSRVPKLVFSTSFHQHIVSLWYHYCLSLYISFRYYFAKRKY